VWDERSSHSDLSMILRDWLVLALLVSLVLPSDAAHHASEAEAERQPSTVWGEDTTNVNLPGRAVSSRPGATPEAIRERWQGVQANIKNRQREIIMEAPGTRLGKPLRISHKNVLRSVTED